MVAPHRPRSQSLGVARPAVGVGAPSIRALPRFSPPDTAVQPTVEERPKLLAVDFPAAEKGGEPTPPFVYVGTTLYEKGKSGADLATDPSTSDEFSVSLPLVEPRSYLPGNAFSLVYEGRVSGDGVGGFVGPLPTTGPLGSAAADGTASFKDNAAFFCSQGVYDVEMMRDLGENELGLTGDALETFAETHADYVQVTDGFPVLSDSYWVSERGQDCGGRAACFSAFGRSDIRDLDVSRDLSVVKAFQTELIVRPRRGTSDEVLTIADRCTRCDADPASPSCSVGGAPKDKLTLLWEHCFPGGVRYTLRASQQWVLSSSRAMHDVTARVMPGTESQPLYECVRDCNPKVRFLRSRAFEISSTVDCSGDDPPCAVGRAPNEEVVCSYDATVSSEGEGGISLDDSAARCVFENLVARFAVYRGLRPSTRGMTFSWQTAGGFSPMLGVLTTQSTSVLPQHMSYLPEYESIAIVDAASLGLSLMSLDTLTISRSWPVY
jgi:hypothetical protein